MSSEKAAPPLPTLVGFALRQRLRSGYRLRDLRTDVLAGVVVGTVALPLSMALAIACGVPPQHGLYTAIVAGSVAALCGGSAVQVSGPTAAFVVVLSPITAQFGLGGLLVATILAGAILILMGMLRLGRFIEFVPYPVTAGFTSGIAVVIATLQLRDLLGLSVLEMPDQYPERLAVLIGAIPTVRWADVVIGGLTLALLVVAPRWIKRVPAALVALPVGALAALALGQLGPDFQADTIRSRFQGIPSRPPLPLLPWQLGGNGEFPWTLDTWRALSQAAVPIALLGAIESLLSAVVASAISGTDHDPDAELIGQGLANIIAPWFGGFAATGAIARTAANVRSGARSPVAAVAHSVFLLLGVLVAAPWLGYLPMASMAALLLIVAWNMSEAEHVVRMFRVAPRSDKVVLLTCFGLTVLFDMAIAVTVGVMLAALLFMQRMSTLTSARLFTESHPALKEPLPPGVLLYEVAGPLFFGAAERAMGAVRRVDRTIGVVVLDLRSVPVMDATGLVALESALDRLRRAHVFTVIAGIQNQPLELMARAGYRGREWVMVYRSFEMGLDVARNLGQLVTPGVRGVHEARH